jgi:hypothetical protein
VATSPAHTATRLRMQEGDRILPSLEEAEAAPTEAQAVAVVVAADLTEAVVGAAVPHRADLREVDLQEVDPTSSFRFRIVEFA